MTENSAQTAEGRKAMAEALRGRCIERVEYEQREAAIYGLLLHLDDGSIMHVEPLLPPWKVPGLELWQTTAQEVAEANAEHDDLGLR